MKSERYLFWLILALSTLVTINYYLLRGLKATLVVTASHGGAEMVPHLYFWVLPLATLSLTALVARLLARFSLPRVFYLVTGGFLVCFLLYALFPMPVERSLILPSWLEGGFFRGIGFVIHHPFIALFYVLAELWWVLIVSILFWTYLNQRIPLKTARTLYVRLMVDSSLACLIAGPLTQLCSQVGQSWDTSFRYLLLAVVFIGIGTLVCFLILDRHLAEPSSPPVSPKQLTLRESLRTVMNSRPLRWMLIIVLADHIAYPLVEVIFLDKLHTLCPHPTDYCRVMGQMTWVNGLVIGVLSLVVAPWCFRRFQWTAPALITPVVFLITAVIFCLLVTLDWGSLGFFVVLGGVQYYGSRACKYAFFGPALEMAFIPLSYETQVQGKLIISGVGARLGKVGSAFINMGVLSIYGTVAAAAPLIGVIGAACGAAWIHGTRIIGKPFETKTVNSGT